MRWSGRFLPRSGLRPSRLPWRASGLEPSGGSDRAAAGARPHRPRLRPTPHPRLDGAGGAPVQVPLRAGVHQGLRRDSEDVSDPAPDRARQGPAASGQPDHHRDLFPGRVRERRLLQLALPRPRGDVTDRVPECLCRCSAHPRLLRPHVVAAGSRQKSAIRKKHRRRARGSVEAMIKKLSHVNVFVEDQDRAKAFYTEKLGFEVRSDATMDGFRWLTVGPKDQPDLNILLARPQPPMFSEEDAATLLGLVAKGVMGAGVIETDDIRGAYEELKGKGVTSVQSSCRAAGRPVQTSPGHWPSVPAR